MKNFTKKQIITAFILIVTSISLASCKSKIAKNQTSENEKFIIEDQSIENNVSDVKNEAPYQTIDNEQQASALNQQIESQIQEIEVKDRVLFGYDSFELSDDAKRILNTQISWLTSDSKINIILEGHCDERGTREYNIALGEKRANSVKKYLVEGGVNQSRIKVISYGKERPAFLGNSEDSLSKNRRVVTSVN